MDRLAWLSGTDLETGESLRLEQAEVRYGYRHTDLPEDLLVVEAAFNVHPDDPEAVQRRMDDIQARRKSSQPLPIRSAGCVFKNPTGLSAGQMIDRAGCKGLSVGDVVVSDAHANFIVNRGRGTAADLLGLIEQVRGRVRREGGPELELELQVLGARGLEVH